MTDPVPGSREALAAIVWGTCGSGPNVRDSNLIADALIAAGWRFDGSCRDCCHQCGHDEQEHAGNGCLSGVATPDHCECVGFNPTFDS